MGDEQPHDGPRPANARGGEAARARVCHSAPDAVVETGAASRRRRNRRISSRLRLPAAQFPHRDLSPLPVSTLRPAHRAQSLLFRHQRRLRGLRAASGFLLDHFRLAGGGALGGAGVLARLVRGAGAVVPEKIRPAGRGAGSVRLDRPRVFSQRTLLPPVLVAQCRLRIFPLAADFLRNAPRHVWNRAGADGPGRFGFAAVQPECGRVLQVAGVQMEFPLPLEVPAALDRLLARHPEADLLVLSEYTFDGPIPERVKTWCRQHNKYLIAGGKDFISSAEFYNTAFVVGPDGDIVFRQVKSVPIQFFKDGRPATERKLWNSPWGKIGLCVCYDLSYRRVTDELIRQGAQAIIAPTMDVANWGEYQHRLHARVGPVRAAEYQVPVFRVCSSGISQLIARSGRILASRPFPGEQAMIAGSLELAREGRLPLDRWLAPVSALVTAALILWLAGKAVLGKFSKL